MNGMDAWMDDEWIDTQIYRYIQRQIPRLLRRYIDRRMDRCIGRKSFRLMFLFFSVPNPEVHFWTTAKFGR